MAPTLTPGDRVLVRYDAAPAVGDVVLLRLEGTVAVKRLTSMVDRTITAESDNPGEPGAWSGVVDAEAVLAVVLLRVWPRPGALRRAPST